MTLAQEMLNLCVQDTAQSRQPRAGGRTPRRKAYRHPKHKGAMSRHWRPGDTAEGDSLTFFFFFLNSPVHSGSCPSPPSDGAECPLRTRRERAPGDTSCPPQATTSVLHSEKENTSAGLSTGELLGPHRPSLPQGNSTAPDSAQNTLDGLVFRYDSETHFWGLLSSGSDYQRKFPTLNSPRSA